MMQLLENAALGHGSSLGFIPAAGGILEPVWALFWIVNERALDYFWSHNVGGSFKLYITIDV